ncbi:MAG: M48 family metallopeptidase [Salegentibacter sp.]
MKFSFLILLFFSLSTQVVSQSLKQTNIEDIINGYKESLATAEVIEDCGHALDGPAYWVKAMENRSLDMALPAVHFNKDEIGKKIYREIIKVNEVSGKHTSEAGILQIISNLSSKMLPSERRVFKLTILDSGEINAYSTVGGYIYITTGLIDFVDSADELAFIIGHEMGHDVLLHTQRKVTKLLLSSDLLGKVNLENYTNLVVGINTRFTAPFDQIDEYEADEYGVRLAAKAGYNPDRFGDFFKKIEKGEGRGLLKKLTATHPFASHRRKCLNHYISEKR